MVQVAKALGAMSHFVVGKVPLEKLQYSIRIVRQCTQISFVRLTIFHETPNHLTQIIWEETYKYGLIFQCNAKLWVSHLQNHLAMREPGAYGTNC